MSEISPPLHFGNFNLLWTRKGCFCGNLGKCLDQQLVIILILCYGYTINPEMGVKTACFVISFEVRALEVGKFYLGGYKDHWNRRLLESLLLSFLLISLIAQMDNLFFLVGEGEGWAGKGGNRVLEKLISFDTLTKQDVVCSKQLIKYKHKAYT